MKTGYSYKKGLGKGALIALKALAGILIFAGVADLHITDLIQQYLFPLIGGVTLSGLLGLATNFVKFHWITE